MPILTSVGRAALLAAVAAMAMSASAAAPKAAAAPAGSARDLFSFAAGARIVEAPADALMTQMDASPLNLIDDSTVTDWTGEAGQATFVFELSELTELSRIAFDTGGLNRDAKAPNAFVVELSKTSATQGYTQILRGTLQMARNGQSFAFKVGERPVGQWVRLTILTNHGDDYQGFTGFHGYGQQLTTAAAMPGLTGKYDGASGWGRVNLAASGAQVSGCYEFQQGEFAGVVDGRVLKLSMLQREDGTRMNGLFQLLPGGKLMGLVRSAGPAYRDTYAAYYSAQKVNGKPNSC